MYRSTLKITKRRTSLGRCASFCTLCDIIFLFYFCNCGFAGSSMLLDRRRHGLILNDNFIHNCIEREVRYAFFKCETARAVHMLERHIDVRLALEARLQPVLAEVFFSRRNVEALLP